MDPRRNCKRRTLSFIIFALFALMHIAEGKSSLGLRSARQASPGSNFLKARTSEHVIDLNNYPNKRCVNHWHAKNNPYSPDPRDSLKITPRHNSDCFILYNDYQCQGVHLKFQNVRFEKVLKLTHFQDQYNNKYERLLNFDIFPSSISACSAAGSQLSEKGACGSNYALWVGNVVENITEKCVNVTRAQYNYPDVIYYQIYPNASYDNTHLEICIETYSEIGCSGEIIKFIMTIPITQIDSHIKKLPWTRLWEKTGELLVNTDIKSVRKCPCPKPTPTPPPRTNSKPISENGKGENKWCKLPFCQSEDDSYTTNRNIPSATTQPTYFQPTSEESTDDSTSKGKAELCQHSACKSDDSFINKNLQPTTTQPTSKISINGSASRNESKSCQIPHCKSIGSFINSGNKSNGFFAIYNGTSCSGNPIFHTKSINRTELLHFMIQYEGFSNLTITDCRGFENNNQIPLMTTTSEKLEDVLSRLLKARQPETGKRKSGENEEGTSGKVGWILLSIAGVMALTLLTIVLIFRVLVTRNKRNMRGSGNRNNGRIPKHRAAAGAGSGIHQTNSVKVNTHVNGIHKLQTLCEYFGEGGFEIPRGNIDIGDIRDNSAHIIGVGEYSIAFKGTLAPGERTVAVKAMKSGHGTPSAMKRMLKECKFFMDCGKHKRVVELLGVCTEQIRSGEIFMVMEFCDNGTLKSFLVQNRSHFLSLVKDGEMIQHEDLNAYAEHSVEEGPPVKFNTFQLFKWCWEMADAMEYLAMKKIIHVSLCTRNVMLDSHFKAKICDFHLARMPKEGTITNNPGIRLTMHKERNFPWRFCATESLLDDMFSTESDVWTFGIFMWEVLTLGSTPYPEHMYGGEFTMVLKHGYRLLKPELATIEIYELMLICWYDAPEKRPTFTKLKAKLEGMIHAVDKPKAQVNPTDQHD